jgi:hypothetical protein
LETSKMVLILWRLQSGKQSLVRREFHWRG